MRWLVVCKMISKSNYLKIYFQNVRGLRTKTSDFLSNIVISDYDVIVLCETWLTCSINDSELFDNRYFVYRRDRESSTFHSGKSGGGVLIAVSKRWTSCRLHNFESKCEDVWVGIDIKLNNKIEQLLICGIYLPPPIQKHILEHFITNANRVLENTSHSLLLGDFNLSCIQWSGTPKLPLSASCNTNSLFATQLLDFTSYNGLMQYNHILNYKNKILDLVMSSVPVDDIQCCVSPLINVDPYHPPLEMTLHHCNSTYLQPNSNFVLKFHKGDYTKIIEHLNSVDWDEKFGDRESVDCMVERFYEVVNNTIKLYIPRSVPKSASRYPVWFNGGILRVLREKYKYRKLYSKFKNPLDLMTFKLLKDRSLALINESYKKYISSIETNIKNNPKIFWAFIKQKKGSSNGYPSRMYYKNHSSTIGSEMCDLFAQCFSSIYQSSNIAVDLSRLVKDEVTSSYMTKVVFSTDQVMRALRGLDTNKGAGSDSISPMYAVKCAESLSMPLSLIFNKSLSVGVFPTLWKEARIVPIYKSGDKSNVENFRPISILPVFGKVFESLLCPLIYWHVKQLIIPQQHGFVKARSTTTNLIDFISDIVEAVDSRASADVIYTDFSKAFDMVNIKMLKQKLSLYGISGQLLNWCSSYLTGRKSKIVLNGYESRVYVASSGVPQGSHLGPLFFIIFINDVISCFHHSRCYLYADDLKIVKRISSDVDVNLLQEDLNRFAAWCDSNYLRLNTNKCYFMHFSRKKAPHSSSYTLCNHMLREVDTIRDLGVIIDNKLRFHMHIDNVVTRSFKLLGFILRNCKEFKTAQSRITIFNCLIRTILEYCSSVWSPMYEVHKKRIESVNKRFLWHLAFQEHKAKELLSYSTRLGYFKLQNLEKRREITDLKFLHKLVNNQLDCPLLLSRVFFNTPYKLPRYSKYTLFFNKLFKSNLGHFSSLNRMQILYNKVSKGTNVDVFTRPGPFIRSIIQRE
jgi:hypothetical protein